MRTHPARIDLALIEVSAARSATGRPAISPEDRYPHLVGCPAATRSRLRELNILVVGTGSVGGRIALHLARLGVRSLTLVDPKSYKAQSLLTHEVTPSAIGQPKALEVGRRSKAICPSTRVFVLVGSVEALGWDALADVDLVIMAPDLLSVEVELAQRCQHLGRPLMQAAVHGETLTVQVRFTGNQDPQGPCAACFLGPVEWKLLSQQARFSCEGAGKDLSSVSGEVVAMPVAPVTQSFSCLCALAADLAVHQVLRHVLQLGEPVADTLLEYCGYTHRTVASRLARNDSCPTDHFAYRRLDWRRPLAGLSLAALAEVVTDTPARDDTVFEVAGMDWVEMGACLCPQPAPVRQFLSRAHRKTLRCPRCAAPVAPLDFYTQRRVGASVLGEALTQPLCRLGARQAQSVIVRTAEAGALVRYQPLDPFPDA